jgi:hypothetical protein
MIGKTAIWSVGILLGIAGSLPADTFEVEQQSDGVAVKRDGNLLARYVVKSGNKPILWPIIGSYGEEVTRQYPMRAAGPDERADHPHHRSFWFTHGDVNGISFWHEGERTGEIVHKGYRKVAGGETAVICTENEWIGPDGDVLCQDVRTMTFGVDGQCVWIDFDSTVTATDDTVVFGDTKEGCFGVRVAGTVKVDAQQGGHIVNSEGQTDREAWGKPAAWCDYHGPIHGKTVGIAIMNHPTSFRYPTYWHVRTYGLFTANPFGVSDFTKAPKGTGNHTMKKGESFTLRYRVLIHKGDEKEGKVAEAFEAYAHSRDS